MNFKDNPVNPIDVIIQKLQHLFDKNKCYDIFQYTKVNNMRMYPSKSMRDVLMLRFEMRKAQQ